MRAEQEEKPVPKKRGLALVSPERRREIAAKGGNAAQKKGVAHKWTSEQARVAGKKGAQASLNNRSKKPDSPNALL